MKRDNTVLLLILVAIVLAAMLMFNMNNVSSSLPPSPLPETFKNDCGCAETSFLPERAEHFLGFNTPYTYYNSPQTIGCGGRRIPCNLREAIPNVLEPVDVSNKSIAPRNVFLHDHANGRLNKVGSVYKVFGSENQIYPLYGIPSNNRAQWDYYTRLGATGEWVRVIQPHNRNYELANNDAVELDGQCGKWRVTIYDQYLPTYAPFS